MHKMCECSLGYKELVRAIENGECENYERLKDDDLNKFSIVHRVAGMTFCRGWFCQHRKKHIYKFIKEKIKTSLEFNENEKEYIKKRGWDFLLDDDWVSKNMFEPTHIVEEGNIGFKQKSPVPIRNPKVIEDGDIVVFHEYREDENVKSEFREDGYRTDRFYEWNSDNHNDDSCPNGYVVPKPKKEVDEDANSC